MTLHPADERHHSGRGGIELKQHNPPAVCPSPGALGELPPPIPPPGPESHSTRLLKCAAHAQMANALKRRNSAVTARCRRSLSWKSLFILQFFPH
ncbi:hypothetical protein PBY51_005086 [Eleginops maclovinus]|uniref:Uncharacterized protein n=1 Tax=Eleginops maclovinus TaxID=56733 RepID=A0AAN8AH81_ELEMC|nr:hypothetical protein PBY51_005086 [Eleginops maclovinus]